MSFSNSSATVPNIHVSLVDPRLCLLFVSVYCHDTKGGSVLCTEMCLFVSMLTCSQWLTITLDHMCPRPELRIMQ